MRYKFTVQSRVGSWVYVLGFGKNTPTNIDELIEYSDDNVSAEDFRGVRHYVYFKNGKIVSIHLHDALGIMPQLDPSRPETLRMPGMTAIMFGNPSLPTLLVRFREEPPDHGTAYGLSPNVFLTFQGKELAQLYVRDVDALLPEED